MTAPQTVLTRSLDLDRGQEGGMVRQSLQSAMPPWAASELRQVVRQRGEDSLSQVPLLAGTETFSPPSMQLLGKFQLHGVNCFSSPRSGGGGGGDHRGGTRGGGDDCTSSSQDCSRITQRGPLLLSSQ